MGDFLHMEKQMTLVCMAPDGELELWVFVELEYVVDIGLRIPFAWWIPFFNKSPEEAGREILGEL